MGVFTRKKRDKDGEVVENSQGDPKRELTTLSKVGIGGLILSIPGIGTLIGNIFGNILGNTQDAGVGVMGSTAMYCCLPLSSCACLVVMLVLLLRFMD